MPSWFELGASLDDRLFLPAKSVIVSVDDAALERLAEIVGAKEVVSYPSGHYNDTAKQGVSGARFALAVTTEYDQVAAGADKLALPRGRIAYGILLDAFAAAVQ